MKVGWAFFLINTFLQVVRIHSVHICDENYLWFVCAEHLSTILCLKQMWCVPLEHRCRAPSSRRSLKHTWISTLHTEQLHLLVSIPEEEHPFPLSSPFFSYLINVHSSYHPSEAFNSLSMLPRHDNIWHEIPLNACSTSEAVQKAWEL